MVSTCAKQMCALHVQWTLQLLGDSCPQTHFAHSQESDALRSLAAKTEGFEKTIKAFLERFEEEPALTPLAAPGSSPAKRVKIVQKSKCPAGSPASASKAVQTKKNQS